MTRVPLIISVDDHVVEPPDLWKRWLPAKYRDRGPHVVKGGFQQVPGGDGHNFAMVDGGPQVDWWVYEEISKPLPMPMHWAGYSREELQYRPISFADMRPGYYNPKERLADMDLNHTERSLCFPNTLPRFCGQSFSEASDRDLGLACIYAYNDWMIDEWCGDSGGRLLPIVMIPLWDPKLAAAEVRRNAARGCRAVTFSELPANLGLPSIHNRDRHWDPLFAACDETGTVVCMHIGSGSKMSISSEDAPQGVRMALTTQNAMACLADWLLSGVLLRFPHLKIALSECQIGWIPYLLERIDNVFLRNREFAELSPDFDVLPSSQVPGRVYGCFFEDDFGLRVRDDVGVSQITFEVDYPHQDTNWPNSLAYLEKITVDLTDEELFKIVRGNAIEMLGLPLSI
jgi:predicted TIM-barrel fold metal-dependent hydrolase